MSESIPASSPADKPGDRPAGNHAGDKPVLESKHRGLLMLAVMCVSIIQFLDVTISIVAIPHMQTSLGASLDTISWVLTSFIMAGIMVTPMVGWLSDRFGSRRLFLLAVGGFLVASMLCGAATSLAQMVAFRALQGIFAAIIGPMSQTIMFDINPPSKQPAAMTIWGMVVMVAPITGPMIGGLIIDSLNWRWIFYINLPLGIPTLALLVWLLPSRPVQRRHFDILGVIVLALALAALQLMLDRGQHQDWFNSWEIKIELVVFLSMIWMFLTHTATTKKPLFPPALMKNGNFMAILVFMMFIGVANIAVVSILPTMFDVIYNYGPMETGLLLAPRGIGTLFSMLVVGRLMKVVDGRYLIMTGYLVAALALWTMSQWSLDMGRMPIRISGLIQGFGLGLTFMPMNMAAFATLPIEYRPDGSSLLNLSRNIGSSFGISVIVTMLARNTQISHSDIAANVTSYSLPAIDPVSTAERFGTMGGALIQMIDGEVSRQALMISYLDNFHAVSLFILLIAPIALLLKPMKETKSEPPALME